MTKYDNLDNSGKGLKSRKKGLKFEKIVQMIHELQGGLVHRPTLTRFRKIQNVDIDGILQKSKQTDIFGLFDGVTVWRAMPLELWQCKHSINKVTPSSYRKTLQTLASFAVNYMVSSDIALYFFHYSENKQDVFLKRFTYIASPDVRTPEVYFDEHWFMQESVLTVKNIEATHKEKFQNLPKQWEERKKKSQIEQVIIQ